MEEKARLQLNKADPLIMHIDLNSCFAIIEQQANRLLRGRPVGIAAYDTPRGLVLAASYQAKAKGVKLGVSVGEARALCPGIVIMTPDPAKYREAHRRFKELLLDYTDDVHPKSIDEFVLNFYGSPILRQKLASAHTKVDLVMKEIGLEIKQKVAERIGEAVTVNIGIGPNRFLAKYAAGFDKPDGMTLIDHRNIESRYKGMELVDLPGINTRYKRRLQMYGISTPLDFLKADRRVLEKVVFKSITGYYWYLRLRGYEIDNYESRRSTIGHQYALSKKTEDPKELARLLMKLCEKVGRRLRRAGLTAGGIHLYLSFMNYKEGPRRDNGFIGGENLASQRAWHRGEKTDYRLYSSSSVYQAARALLLSADILAPVRGMSITVFNLQPANPEQLNLFEAVQAEQTDSAGLRSYGAERRISDAIDQINNRYGEFVITPAAMIDMQGEILDRVAFGSIRDL